MKSHIIFNKWFVAIYFLNLVACNNTDYTDLKHYIDEVKSRPKSGIEPLPEIRVVEPYVFNPDGVRDPFRPADKNADPNNADIATGNGIRPDFDRRKEELEAYSIDTLKMVGTLTNKKGFWALVKVKDGTVHPVQVGNHMGQNYGKIIRILPDKIELMEIVPDKPGTWREQQASLVLAD